MTQYKGLILAGGTGSRLAPLTLATSKQLMPIYDKPMVFYPLSLLMQAGIRDIGIIVTPSDVTAYRALLGDGREWGINITFIIQPTPAGIGQAPVLAQKFLGDAPFVMALGDNLFQGPEIAEGLSLAMARNRGATLFTIPVTDARCFGVAQYNASGQVVDLVEKPQNPQSNEAVTGLYVFDKQAALWAEWMKPSPRGELEVIDLLKIYQNANALDGMRLTTDTNWRDNGAQEDLFQAANLIRRLQIATKKPVGSPEFTAFQNGWIDIYRFTRLGLAKSRTDYGALLLRQSRHSRTADLRKQHRSTTQKANG